MSDKTFRPVFNQDIDADFMVLAMNSRYYRHQVEQAISGAEGLANNLPLSSLRSFIFAIPKFEEQRAIANFLNISTNELSKAIRSAEQEVALLLEYRTRLIADVVTGKVDVRAAAARLPEEVEEPEIAEEIEERVDSEDENGDADLEGDTEDAAGEEAEA